MNTRKLTTLALLLAAALIIFIIEAQLPIPVPIPGVKLGLANIITLVTLVWYGRREAFTILILRIILSGIYAGGLAGIVYGLSGGVLCFIVMSLCVGHFRRLLPVSMAGAVAHNVGQVAAAIVLTRTRQIIWYLLPLGVSGLITGALTGVVADILIKRLNIRRDNR